MRGKATPPLIVSVLIDRLLNILFPSRCPTCGNPSDSWRYNPLCTSCWETIKPYKGPACRICGIPTISPQTTICESCVHKSPPFSQILSYGIYEGNLREAIHLLKFKGMKRLSIPLTALLLTGSALPHADAIVPVPLHKKRLWKREFNQTALIGRHLARGLKIPLRMDMLKKVKETIPQTDVRGAERSKNVRGSFAAAGRIQGLRLILIDDVITTGATVTECAKVLRKAGAAEVIVVALARSMPKY